eukprot:SAG11_NODE_610_length_8221_cov_4.801650_11_plen_229_part_00
MGVLLHLTDRPTECNGQFIETVVEHSDEYQEISSVMDSLIYMNGNNEALNDTIQNSNHEMQDQRDDREPLLSPPPPRLAPLSLPHVSKLIVRAPKPHNVKSKNIQSQSSSSRRRIRSCYRTRASQSTRSSSRRPRPWPSSSARRKWRPTSETETETTAPLYVDVRWCNSCVGDSRCDRVAADERRRRDSRAKLRCPSRTCFSAAGTQRASLGGPRLPQPYLSVVLAYG